MAKKMLIDATHAEETRVVVVDGNKVEEFDFESESRRQLAGNIYLAKVTRVEPSLQAAFVDYGGNRHGFLAFSEIHPDYYQIPVADRQALMEEEERLAAEAAEEEEKPKKATRSRRPRRTSPAKAESAKSDDPKTSAEPESEINGMETIDLGEGGGNDRSDEEAVSPMERVAETPVEEPQDQPSGDDDGKDDCETEATDAAARDETIEAVADDDTHEDIRPVRKPRPRKYKIQEVIKVRQILLVQVVKEERGNKGAALTTYLSLAGRYCVLMPNTARGGGISRKITNAADRSKLKTIAQSIDVPKGAGLIIRTAGAKRTKTEIKRDYEYLQRLWEQIRELTLKSIAPAKIYEEGDLVKRSIRDLYNREIDEVLVEGEKGYRIAKDFMKMIMPSHAKNVKHYADPMPLFARYQVESYLGSMFNPTVQLKSGGYIVIGVTEALVAIDVNSGKATKEGSIEDTATKTNLEAAEEVARQLRLRDLAGLIVIDFIDMAERKNNAAVEKKLKDKLKSDRARIQVGRISGFGLLEMSRQRLRPGMIEATTQPCAHCHGTGLIRSDDSMALQVLRSVEEEGTRGRSREVLLKCPVGIANYLMNQKREHIALIEARYGMSVRVEGDPSLVAPDFTMDKFKTATRSVPEVTTPVVSVDTSLMDQVDEDAVEEDEVEPEEAPAAPEAQPEPQPKAEDEGKPKKKRRRRRRRSKAKDTNGEQDQAKAENGSDADAGQDAPKEDAAKTGDEIKKTEAEAMTAEAPKPETAPEDVKETSAKSEEPAQSSEKPEVAAPAETAVEAPVAEAPEAKEEPAKPEVSEAPAAAESKAESAPAAEEPAPQAEESEAQKARPARTRRKAAAVIAEVIGTTESAEETSDAPAEATASSEDGETATEEKPEEEPKPRRRGWWSIGR